MESTLQAKSASHTVCISSHLYHFHGGGFLLRQPMTSCQFQDLSEPLSCWTTGARRCCWPFLPFPFSLCPLSSYFSQSRLSLQLQFPFSTPPLNAEVPQDSVWELLHTSTREPGILIHFHDFIYSLQRDGFQISFFNQIPLLRATPLFPTTHFTNATGILTITLPTCFSFYVLSQEKVPPST